jgi:hypothetical protein
MYQSSARGGGSYHVFETGRGEARIRCAWRRAICDCVGSRRRLDLAAQDRAGPRHLRDIPPGRREVRTDRTGIAGEVEVVCRGLQGCLEEFPRFRDEVRGRRVQVTVGSSAAPASLGGGGRRRHSGHKGGRPRSTDAPTRTKTVPQSAQMSLRTLTLISRKPWAYSPTCPLRTGPGSALLPVPSRPASGAGGATAHQPQPTLARLEGGAQTSSWRCWTPSVAGVRCRRAVQREGADAVAAAVIVLTLPLHRRACDPVHYAIVSADCSI